MIEKVALIFAGITAFVLVVVCIANLHRFIGLNDD